MGFVHHLTAAGVATGWMEGSRPSPGSTISTSASLPATDRTCRPIDATQASGGTLSVAQSTNLIPPTRLAFVGRRA